MRTKLYDYPARDERDVIMIHTGLSATVCGHSVTVQRDEARRVAVVVVQVTPGYNVTGAEQFEVERAARLLADRTERFLGRRWTVVRWSPYNRSKRDAG